MTHNIAVIGGDGIGPEVDRRGAQGRSRRRRRHRPRPTSTSAAPATCATARSSPTRCSTSSRSFDAILLGAVGTPEVPPGRDRARPAAEDALRARPLHQPAAVRRHCAGQRHAARLRRHPREHRGHLRRRGRRVLRKGTPHEVATQGSVNTRMGVERCVRYAFELAGEPSAQAPHPGAQDQRAHVRRRPVGAHLQRGRRRVPRRRHRLQPRRRRLHLLRAGPAAATT